MDQLQHTIAHWVGNTNYSLMLWADSNYFIAFSSLIFVSTLLGLSPLKTHIDQNFFQICCVFIRKAILIIIFFMLLLPPTMLVLYEISTQNQDQSQWVSWFISHAKSEIHLLPISAILGFSIKLLIQRYALTFISYIAKSLRNNQSDDKLSDIRQESNLYRPKDFEPAKHYQDDAIFLAIDNDGKPASIPLSVWRETNAQIIGPTRYGKGIIIGCIADQVANHGDGLFYIDPKNDKFLPHIMYQAAQRTGRKFYYLSLNDDGPGTWGPFSGGSKRDALARIEFAFGLNFTGDPGTDYYKSQEYHQLELAFSKTRSIPSLANHLKDTDANRLKVELSRWAGVKSLCPKSGRGFSIKQALKENALVYVQGSLDDSVVKTATKVFIQELIQESRRLRNERTSHLSVIIDEVSFLVSKPLTEALATAVGFDVNFILAYQSPDDLLNVDDKTINSRYVAQSINVNSQIKAIYGGSDFDTAQWVANLSGEITKEVTRFEKTNISAVGGETWDSQRSVGIESENLINTNIVLSLPPRVFVLIRPQKLAAICYSSFVKVQDEQGLQTYIASLISHAKSTKPKSKKTQPNKTEQPPTSNSPDLETEDFAKDFSE